jgi:hypothetical protein
MAFALLRGRWRFGCETALRSRPSAERRDAVWRGTRDRASRHCELAFERFKLDRARHRRCRGGDRSIQLEAHSLVEKDSLALDIRTPAQEKIAQFGCVVITTECGIEAEKYFAGWRKVTLQIVQEKIPFRRAPKPFRRIV